MRILAISILALCVSFAQGQRTQGTYHPDAKTSDAWSINDHGTLIWNSKPYLPVGTIVDSPAAVDLAEAAGINDFVVDLPASGAGWEEAFAALNRKHASFLLRVNSLAPMATGIAVEPQGYRVAGITQTQTVHVNLPGIQSAFVVVALRRDGTIIESKSVQLQDGVLNYTVQAPEGMERVLLVYPVTTSAELPDYWDSLDKHRDSLLQAFKRHAPGAGLRGIVDPFGRTLVLPGKDLRFVPTSSYFHDEFRDYLLDQYKALETAERTWALGGVDIKDFDALARLVPLWSGSRGVSDLWDPLTNRLYPCDNRRSRVWADITTVIENAGARRYARICKDLHDTVDVPIVQQWAGWASAYETSSPALDGIGMRTSGSATNSVFDAAGRAESSLLRWKRPGWLPATEVDLGPGADASQLSVVLASITGLGGRGVFIRAESPAILKAIPSAAALVSDPTLVNTSVHAIFFPENAENPATIVRYPNGMWALPSPMDGDRVDMGTKFLAYRYKSADGKQTFVISAKTPGRVKFIMSKAQGVVVTTVDGSDPKVKIDKNNLECDMGTLPIIITGTSELPVPEPAYAETVERITRMATMMEEAHKDAPEELYYYQVAQNEFKTTPGTSFATMRTSYRALSAHVGQYVWIEGESSKDHNFSEIDTSPACSSGAALALRTQLPPGPAGYYASYQVPVRSPAEQEVWLAARIPADRRGDVQVIIGGQSDDRAADGPILGGQTMTISSDPVSPYGNGFAWYKLGVTKLTGGVYTLRVVVTGETASDLAIDVLLVTPGHFVPTGVDPPEPLDFAKPLTPVKNPKKRGSGH